MNDTQSVEENRKSRLATQLGSVQAYQWREIELSFFAEDTHDRPYETVDMWALFTHSDGTVLKRPAFYDADNTWKIRFASPLASGIWTFTTHVPCGDPGLDGLSGEFPCLGASYSSHPLYQHGFWQIPRGKRNLYHADGTPSLLIGDTGWAIPFRATVEECTVYAKNRQRLGFNATLLMTVQPDLKSQGPRNRVEDESFDVGFEDLPTGHINDINISYFQYLDKLVDVLVEHELCPVYQPLFHGYGWKGGGVIGTVVPSDEYERYVRYLIARYGARPAIYLIGGDGPGYEESLNAAGKVTEEWDCYGQPAGIHYCPHGDNRARQDEEWLDFQWCQTGHAGLHIQERVADMWRNEPKKAVANGEPTYEHMGREDSGVGWWQGEEAIRNLCAGGTMGVVYGAGSLWPWKRHKDEPGFGEWSQSNGYGWRECLEFSGARYVGALSKVFKGQPFAEMEPNWSYSYGFPGLAIADTFYLIFLPQGNDVSLANPDAVPLPYRIFDAKTGKVLDEGKRDQGQSIVKTPDTDEPLIAVFS